MGADVSSAAAPAAGDAFNSVQAEKEHFYSLSRSARTALKQGRDEEAAKLAKELQTLAAKFKHDWNYGNAIHHSNQILGRLAIAKDQLEEAENRLLASVEIKGSPQLNSFGPSMFLANELLAKGGKRAVLRYFERCKTFWKLGADRLDGWTADVKAGRTPDFGRSLRD
jgi:hypothetical protein